MSEKSCETCRYGKDKKNPEFDYCDHCKTNNEPTSKSKLRDNWLPIAKVRCDDCDIEEGIWEITVLKQYRGSYPKELGLVCNHCLIKDIEGYHTGGGLHAEVIAKIVRKRKAE